MIIVRIRGGLGNQLQQYAMYRKFIEMRREARVDLSWFREDIQKKQIMPRKLELSYFQGIEMKECTRDEKIALVGNEKNPFTKLQRRLFPMKSHYFYENGRMYLPEVFLLEDGYIDGYWACESYYHEMMPTLQGELQFPKSQEPRNTALMNRMKQENSVSIHIRRGDYLNPENEAVFGNICTEKYYQRAMDIICEKVRNPHFYIFSDDGEYAREKYCGEDFTVIDWNTGEYSFHDMQLMSCCKHNICANSTFSFWGARLNPNPDKILIRPLKHRNNQRYDRQEMEKLWQGYLLLDSE